MARKSYKQQLIEEFLFLREEIEEKWRDYSSKKKDMWGDPIIDFPQTQENIHYNVECWIYEGGMETKEKAIEQGVIDG